MFIQIFVPRRFAANYSLNRSGLVFLSFSSLFFFSVSSLGLNQAFSMAQTEMEYRVELFNKYWSRSIWFISRSEICLSWIRLEINALHFDCIESRLVWTHCAVFFQHWEFLFCAQVVIYLENYQFATSDTLKTVLLPEICSSWGWNLKSFYDKFLIKVGLGVDVFHC